MQKYEQKMCWVIYRNLLRHLPTARVFLHRLLENAPASMLWICNDISAIDLACCGVDCLNEARVRAAFKCFFAADWPAAIPVVDRLAPGDFAVVRKRAQIEGVNSPVRLAEMLVEECRDKPGRARGVGFLQSAS